MKIRLTSIYVEDTFKPFRFYTEVDDGVIHGTDIILPGKISFYTPVAEVTNIFTRRIIRAR